MHPVGARAPGQAHRLRRREPLLGGFGDLHSSASNCPRPVSITWLPDSQRSTSRPLTAIRCRGLLCSRTSKYRIRTSSTTSHALAAPNRSLTSSDAEDAEALLQQLHDLDPEHVQVAVGRELQVVPQVEPGPADHRDRSEARVSARSRITSLIRLSRQNRVTWLTKCEKSMWKSVLARLCAAPRPRAVAEHPAVGGDPVVPGVAQHVPAVELVELVGAVAAGQPDRAALEQLLELLDDAEHADPLVLVDVVEVTDGDDPLGVDVLVVLRDALRDLDVAELLRGLGADADQLGEAAVGRPRSGCVRVARGLHEVLELAVELLGERRVRHQAAGEAFGDLGSQRLRCGRGVPGSPVRKPCHCPLSSGPVPPAIRACSARNAATTKRRISRLFWICLTRRSNAPRRPARSTPSWSSADSSFGPHGDDRLLVARLFRLGGAGSSAAASGGAGSSAAASAGAAT